MAFQSDATNLVGNDTNRFADIFVRDRTAGTTTRVSVDPGGTQATGSSSLAATSGDGRFVSFQSSATNLVAGDTNLVADIFVRDRCEVAVGTFDLAPTDLTVAVHEQFSYAFTWTVPSPLDWHEVRFLQLRIRDGADTVLTVIWDEAGDTFRLLNAATGDYGPAFAPGTQHRLQTPKATLYLEETSVVGSGPTGPSVTLNLSLSLKPRAAGHTFLVEVAGSGDQGNADDFTQAGTLTVTK